ncbi:hypothetical protein E2320_019486 [Naja naja]|nr:hypothetical protein E2320_019486 [Naja naja]
MAALNSFVPFDASTEAWKSYIERFDCFLEANDLVDLTGSQQRMLFLNFWGKQMFDTARALLAPQPLNSATWEVLMAKLKNHYAPTPSRIAQRHTSHWCEQSEGESVNQFMEGLQTAALHCKFKELDDALWIVDCRDSWCEQPSLGRKTLAVHQEEVTEEDIDLPGNDDIHQLKTASGNKWQSTKTGQAQSCIGCGSNHPRWLKLQTASAEGREAI